MRWNITVEKGEEVKEGVINIVTPINGVAEIIQRHGWLITNLAPIEEIHEDEDTQTIDIGVLKNANSI